MCGKFHCTNLITIIKNGKKIENLQIKSFLMNPKLTNWADHQDLGRLESWKYQEWKHPKYNPHAVGRVQKLACSSLPIKMVWDNLPAQL